MPQTLLKVWLNGIYQGFEIVNLLSDVYSLYVLMVGLEPRTIIQKVAKLAQKRYFCRSQIGDPKVAPGLFVMIVNY